MQDHWDELKKLFADTLDSGISRAAILLKYRDEMGITRTEIVVPYSLQILEPAGRGESVRQVLEVGPQVNENDVPSLKYFDPRKKQIPIKDIVSFKRIELSDFVSE